MISISPKVLHCRSQSTCFHSNIARVDLMDNCLINCGWWIIDTRPLRLGGRACFSLALRAGCIILPSSSSSRDDDDAFFAGNRTERHYFVGSVPRPCVEGLRVFRVGWRSACPTERCEEIYTSARTDFDGTRCMVIVIRCAARPSHVCVCVSAVFVFFCFISIPPVILFLFSKTNPAGKEETFIFGMRWITSATR